MALRREPGRNSSCYSTQKQDRHAAHALRHADAEVVLIHERNHHTVPSAVSPVKLMTDSLIRSRLSQG
jgi:hypothetical protein